MRVCNACLKPCFDEHGSDCCDQGSSNGIEEITLLFGYVIAGISRAVVKRLGKETESLEKGVRDPSKLYDLAHSQQFDSAVLGYTRAAASELSAATDRNFNPPLSEERARDYEEKQIAKAIRILQKARRYSDNS